MARVPNLGSELKDMVALSLTPLPQYNTTAYSLHGVHYVTIHDFLLFFPN